MTPLLPLQLCVNSILSAKFRHRRRGRRQIPGTENRARIPNQIPRDVLQLFAQAQNAEWRLFLAEILNVRAAAGDSVVPSAVAPGCGDRGFCSSY